MNANGVVGRVTLCAPSGICNEAARTGVPRPTFQAHRPHAAAF